MASYAFFFVTSLYSIGFVGNPWVPRSIDSEPGLLFAAALAVDVAFLTLFAVHHSEMARSAFKRWLTRFIPEAAGRNTCVLMSTICLALFNGILGTTGWCCLGGGK